MIGLRPRTPIAVALGAGLFLLASCSTAPSGPQPGTPAFYWQAARSNFAARDYQKAADQLANVMKTDNEFSSRAQAFRLVLTGALAKAYMDYANDFEMGSRANMFRPMPLRKVMSDYRLHAEQSALQFIETFRKWAAGPPEGNVVLDFPFPSTDMTEIRDRNKITAGSLPDEETQAKIESRIIAQSVAKMAAAAVGADNDIAKAQAAFNGGKAEVPRETFLLAMANALHDQALLFLRDKLDKPERAKLFLTEANNALKDLKETKQTKELRAKIQKAQAKLKG